MNIDKKLTSCIWDNCAKQIVEGYVYVKMNDIIKLQIEDTDLIMDDLETIRYGSDPGDEHVEKPHKLNMNQVANYLVSKGFKYDVSVDGKNEFWTKINK